MTGGMNYQTMNELSSKITGGAECLKFLPFGNGAERVFDNNNVTSTFQGI
jgi:xylulokinase